MKSALLSLSLLASVRAGQEHYEQEAAATAAAQEESEPTTLTPAKTTILNFIRRNARLGRTQLPDALEANDALLDGLVSDNDGFSVLVPADARLAEVVPTVPAAVRPSVFRYHLSNNVIDPNEAPMVVETRLPSAGLTDSNQALILRESDSQAGTFILTNGLSEARVTATVTNGDDIYHAISEVLMPPRSLTETLDELGESVTAVLSAIRDANLLDTLENAQDITLLLPTATAFESAVAEQDPPLTPEMVATVLRRHVVRGVHYSPDIESGTFNTIDGSSSRVVVAEDGGVTVDGIDVVVTDIITANGVVHLIDGVLGLDDDDDTTGSGNGNTGGTTGGNGTSSEARFTRPCYVFGLGLTFLAALL